MSYLLFVDTAAGHTAARRFAAAVDRELGIPRPGTDTHCRIVRQGTQLAVEIDATVRALVGRVVTVRDSGDVQVTITLTGADRSEVARLTGWPTRQIDLNPWTDRPPRDGLEATRAESR